jgi:DNA-binding transcriptional ArsR family regulator
MVKGMLVRIVRRLTLEEISKHIESFERKWGMTFDEFEELFLSKRVDRSMVDVYYEWASLVHAYRGYMEEGELDYSIEELRDLTSEEQALLTPKRLELLYSLGGQRIESINDLARKTRRDVKNVYQDLQLLRKLGFVIFKKMGKRNIVPETLIEEITLLIR